MNLNLPRKISAPLSLIEKTEEEKRRQLLGGKCEVIYHACVLEGKVESMGVRSRPRGLLLWRL